MLDSYSSSSMKRVFVFKATENEGLAAANQGVKRERNEVIFSRLSFNLFAHFLLFLVIAPVNISLKTSENLEASFKNLSFTQAITFCFRLLRTLLFLLY